MMDAPEWVNGTVRSFGHQLGLREFALNDRDAAAVRFENGVTIAFEYTRRSLVISARINLGSRDGTLKRLLSLSHPDAPCGSARVRTFFLRRTGECACAAVIPEAKIEVHAIEEVFQRLWSQIEYLRRAS